MALLLGLIDCSFHIVKGIVKYVWIFHSHFRIVSKNVFFPMYFNIVVSFQLFTILISRTYQLQRKRPLPTARAVQVSDPGVWFCFVFKVSEMIHLIKSIAIPPNAPCMFLPASLGNPHFIHLSNSYPLFNIHFRKPL